MENDINTIFFFFLLARVSLLLELCWSANVADVVSVGVSQVLSCKLRIFRLIISCFFSHSTKHFVCWVADDLVNF